MPTLPINYIALSTFKCAHSVYDHGTRQGHSYVVMQSGMFTLACHLPTQLGLANEATRHISVAHCLHRLWSGLPNEVASQYWQPFLDRSVGANFDTQTLKPESKPPPKIAMSGAYKCSSVGGGGWGY